jgi:hypothetical protein
MRSLILSAGLLAVALVAASVTTKSGAVAQAQNLQQNGPVTQLTRHRLSKVCRRLLSFRLGSKWQRAVAPRTSTATRRRPSVVARPANTTALEMRAAAINGNERRRGAWRSALVRSTSDQHVAQAFSR